MNGLPLALGAVGLLAIAQNGRRGNRNINLDPIIHEARTSARQLRITAQSWPLRDPEFTLQWKELHQLFPDLIGFGAHRIVLPSSNPDIVIKLDIRAVHKKGVGNQDEAKFWETAGPKTRRYLVPVLASDPDGAWLLMESAEPMGWRDERDPDLNRIIEYAASIGLHDMHGDNVTIDGRILDYGEPVSSRGTPNRTKHAGSTNRLPRDLRFLENYIDKPHKRLAAYFPKTAAGTMRPRKGESIYPADGIGYIGDDDGSMVPIDADHLEPMPENIFYADKFSALVDAITSRDAPLVQPGYADLSVDDGELTAQVRDGNHRTFAPIAAGGSMSWVMMSDATKQDLNDPGLKAHTEPLYRAIRKAQKEAGVTLFQRKVATRTRPTKAFTALAKAEARMLALDAAIAEYQRKMLRAHGRATETGFTLAEQLERPQFFWRMRLRELHEARGGDWLDEHVDDSGARALHAERDALDLYDLRKAAGLKHGERLDPVTMRVVTR